MARFAGCERGHSTHSTVDTTVDFGRPHRYRDLPPFPAEVRDLRFPLRVWNHAYHVDYNDGRYCPAQDVVSEAIVSHRVWEPAESILTLHTLADRDARPGLVADFGAHIGWYTALGVIAGRDVLPVESDPENLALLLRNVALLHRSDQLLSLAWESIGTDGHMVRGGAHADPPQPCPLTLDGTDVLAALRSVFSDPTVRVRLAKLDVEGAEQHAFAALAPAFDDGRVDHLLVEVTPAFDSDWAAYLHSLVDYGFALWRMPAKQQPPADLSSPPAGLARLDVDDIDRVVPGWHQENVWAKHDGAVW